MKQVDVRIEGVGGSVVLVTPVTEAAKDWVCDNVEDPQWQGNAFAVEPRYLAALLYGMENDGLAL